MNCQHMNCTDTFSSSVTNRSYNVSDYNSSTLSCFSENLIYLIKCSNCNIQYVGETSKQLNHRMNGHRSSFGKKDLLIAKHFSGEDNCNITHFTVKPIELIQNESNTYRKERESFWIKELRTVVPYGLNNNLDGYNWNNNVENRIVGTIFNRITTKRGSRGCNGHKKHVEQKRLNVLSYESMINKISYLYNNKDNWRFRLKCMINRLKIAKVRNLLWDFAGRLTLNKTLQEIHALAIDMIKYKLFKFSKDKRIERKPSNYVKIKFHSKGMNQLKLNSIIKKHSNVIPDSFNEKDSPCVIYNLSRSIGSTLFNYKQTVNDVITNDWKADNKSICKCSESKFCDPHHGHIVTGNLMIIENGKLRSLMCKGPKYRESRNTNWTSVLKDVEHNLKECQMIWSRKEGCDSSVLNEWYHKILEDVKTKIQLLKRKSSNRKRGIILHQNDVKTYLEQLQKDFVLVPTDKAGNNIAVVCKKFYIEKSMEELKIFQDSNKNASSANTYVPIDHDIKHHITRHIKYLKNQGIENIPEEFPFLYWIPKMHKKPYSKQRYIAASHYCTTKPLSQILTKCLKVIERQHRIICRGYLRNYGIDPMWIVHNSKAVHKCISTYNCKKESRNVRSYDFSTLYTSIPHKQLMKQLTWVIKEAFQNSKKKYISVYTSGAGWTDNPRDKTFALDCSDVIRLLRWLINNIYVTFGDKCFRQAIGIPMGTDCAPFLANLFLYSYEFQWIEKKRKENRYDILTKFKSCCRYIDDLLLINNYDLMKKVMTDIYPEELVLVPDDSDGTSTPFLDLNISIKDGFISTSIYDKRDSFGFPIVNFPFLDGNIPKQIANGVFIGELVRYARACTYLKNFADRTRSLVTKLKAQFFTDSTLQRSWSKFCDNHILLIHKYGKHVLNLHEMWR